MQTLGSIASETITRQYCLTHPLYYNATKFTACCPNRATGAPRFCIVIAPGIGCTAKLWIPVIRDLYARQSAPGAHARITSVWVIDRPNHDDTAVINRTVLDKHYSTHFSTAECSAAVAEFMTSGILTVDERANLVGIGHSSGGASIVDSFPQVTQCPFKLIIFLEGAWVQRTPMVVAIFNILRDRVLRSNAKLETVWSSREAAMKYFVGMKPWCTFEREVQDIMADSFFITQEDTGLVTTKTSTAQRSAAFNDAPEGAFTATERVFKLATERRVKIHAMIAEVQDLWPKPLSEEILANIAKAQTLGVGVSSIKGVGHHAPHEDSKATGKAIYDVLCNFPRAPIARL